MSDTLYGIKIYSRLVDLRRTAPSPYEAAAVPSEEGWE